MADVTDYKLATPVIRADYRRCKIEDRLVIEVAAGRVVGHFGRHPLDEDPTESRRFEVLLDPADVAAFVRKVRDAAITAGEMPARDVAE